MSQIEDTKRVDRFRRAVAHDLGLRFDDSKSEYLRAVMARRTDGRPGDCDGYLRWLESGTPEEELGALADELTVPETYFFRHMDQIKAFGSVVGARLGHDPLGPVRVLSAGCASGEEAYTLAIVLQHVLPPGHDATILGIDVNPSVLRKATGGRYSRWSLREVPPCVERRWFHTEGRDAVINDSLRPSVRFARHNLVVDDPTLWAPDSYDVVFCRNVLMYFTPEKARGVMGRVARALRPGGHLFLGHAETLRGLSQEFHLRHTHETFYYQRKEVGGELHSTVIDNGDGASGSAETPVPSSAEASGWPDAIRIATERVQRLTADAPDRSDTAAASAGVVRRVWELIVEEHFAEALRLVDALPEAASANPDVLLLRAVLQTHVGSFDQAEATCRRLLHMDELSAGAHYVAALCREGAGDLVGAGESHRMAIHLDPSFAMPRVHLGLLARRTGDYPAMRRELGHAATLLETEDASRVVLFGGGFSRHALMALCRAELVRDGQPV